MKSPSFKSASQTSPCPCNPEKTYQQCCQPYHAGELAPSAVILMRSRYSAYALKLECYLLDTWHPKTRPNTLNFKEANAIKWQRLTILSNEKTSEKTATVEFMAEYTVDSETQRLHETSKFVLTHRWLYVDGQFQ